MDITNIKPLFPSVEINEQPLIIAGPCSAESRQQLLETAYALENIGIGVFRAGVWKPRTKPGGFEGRGSIALEWLNEVRIATGMQVATEVASAQHLDESMNAGINAIWIGARTTANPFAVQEIADALAGMTPHQRDSIAVLVKNPVNADLELWIGAIERLYEAGVRRLGAIHRGFSSYGKHIYRNLPEWRIPIEFHRRLPAIPLICDPSHIGGQRELVGPLSMQALRMKFKGLMIESHCHPDCALSDSSQQITPAALADILKEIKDKGISLSAEVLTDLRHQIDELDDRLIDILSQRMAVARQIGLIKRENNIDVVQPERYSSLIKERVEAASKLNLNPGFMRKIMAEIHEESVRQQFEV